MSVPHAPFHRLPIEGEVFDGKYEIGSVLGIGGMAAVFAARHLHLGEMVAIKVLLPDCCDDPAIVERFIQEGKTAFKIRSEHVVRMLDTGIADGRAYLVMEHLEGRDLEAHLRKVGPLPTARAVDLLLQACDALWEAHRLGVIHRDLKPANLFLTQRGDGTPCLKVLDFGISKIQRTPGQGARTTLPNMVMGSPQYMSPEQMMSAARADERSDIWSLGTVLYQLLTGRVAFDGVTPTEICARVLQGSPEPLSALRPDIPVDLEAVLTRCLEKEPAARYANVAELAQALAPYRTKSALDSAESLARGISVVSARPRGEVRDGTSEGSVSTMKPMAAVIPASLARPPRRLTGYLLGMLLAASSLCVIAAYAAGTGTRSFVPPPSPTLQGRTPAAAMQESGTALPPSPIPPAASAACSIAAPVMPATSVISHHSAARASAPLTTVGQEERVVGDETVSAADAGSDDDLGPYDVPSGSGSESTTP